MRIRDGKTGEVIPGQVRIVSDGMSPNTRVEVDGVPMYGVRSVTWHLDAGEHIARATMQVECVEVDVLGRHVGTWKMPIAATARGKWGTLQRRWWRLRHIGQWLCG